MLSSRQLTGILCTVILGAAGTHPETLLTFRLMGLLGEFLYLLETKGKSYTQIPQPEGGIDSPFNPPAARLQSSSPPVLIRSGVTN